VSKRRLFYVAKTRAKDRLFPSMSCSASWRRGRLQLVLKRLAREAPQPLFPPSGGNRRRPQKYPTKLEFVGYPDSQIGNPLLE
jgi:ATP-dependent exoDNAse (exonuclease V) beta subunit